MNNKKICFITSVNDELAYQECLFYINSLHVPDGYSIETIAMRNSIGMCKAYNEASYNTDAKYKVYVHQDVFITNKYFIYDIIKIFGDIRIGIIGVCGTEKIPPNGIWWQGKELRGKVYESSSGKMRLLDFDLSNVEQKEVEGVDGLIIITQYDIKWREDLFDGWHFYDISQSKEFINKGLKVVIPRQDIPWCIHDCGIANISNGYEKYRQMYINEYF